MSRSIVHVCHNGRRYSTLISYFRNLGDQIHLASNGNLFKKMPGRSRPSLIVVDVEIFGKGWPEKLDAFRQANSQYPTLFTIDQASISDEAHRCDLEKSGVLIEPSTNEQIENLLRSNEMGTAKPNYGGQRGRRLRKLLLSVQTKIAAPYVVLSLLLALAGAYIATKTIFETSRQRFTNQLIETRKLASVWVSQEQDTLLETLRLFANTRGVASAISNFDADHLRDLLFPLAVNARIEALEIVNLSGESVLSMRHIADGRIEDYEFSKGEDEFFSWPIVSQVVAQESDSYGDKHAAIVQTSWGDYLYLAGPIFNDIGDLAGVVLVGDALPTLVQRMRESTTGQISIYDLDGQLLATTMMLEPNPIATASTSSIIIRQDSESLARLHTLSDIVYEELLGPLELRDSADAAILGTSLPQDFLIEENLTTRIQVFSLAAVGFLLIILLGIAISRTFTRPLLNLTRATSLVADGDLSVQVSVEGDDEIASLAHSFNSMIDSIKDSKNQLIEAHDTVLNAYDLTIMGWARALELRDMETEGHCRKVTELTVDLAKTLGIEGEELINIRRGAMLHDIGKMAIPDSILLKPGPLTDEEWDEMREHPRYAFEMLNGIDFLRQALDIPYAHHEKWDGSGYPRGLKGDEIPLSARIFAIVDVWDAMNSDRPYRKAWARDKVIRHVISGEGSHFDPHVLSAFIEIVTDGTNAKQDIAPVDEQSPTTEHALNASGSVGRSEEVDAVHAPPLSLGKD